MSGKQKTIFNKRYKRLLALWHEKGYKIIMILYPFC